MLQRNAHCKAEKVPLLLHDYTGSIQSLYRLWTIDRMSAPGLERNSGVRVCDHWRTLPSRI